jgi:hypothetical protein
VKFTEQVYVDNMLFLSLKYPWVCGGNLFIPGVDHFSFLSFFSDHFSKGLFSLFFSQALDFE